MRTGTGLMLTVHSSDLLCTKWRRYGPWVLGVNDPIDVMSIASSLNLVGSSNFAIFVEVCGC